MVTLVDSVNNGAFDKIAQCNHSNFLPMQWAGKMAQEMVGPPVPNMGNRINYTDRWLDTSVI